ncbi:Ig-like domain-containing protein [Anaerolentibacter hominis]|uniref:Ig-like domain-containing protein n=1 Tax=Anaerolentibacter hominis TaxID=3079009 RepID=UPI0031B8149C
MKKVSFPLRAILIIALFLVLSVFVQPPGRSVVAQAADADENSEIKLNVKNKSMVTGSTYTLKVYNTTEDQKVGFKSSDKEIASVNSKGLITANKTGDAVITVTVKQGLKTVGTLTCDVTVGPSAVSVVLSKAKITLAVDNQVTLKTVIKPKNSAEEAKFTSSDTEIATVSSSGIVVAKAPGTVTIYAMIANGKFDKCVVKVVEEVPEKPEEPEAPAPEKTEKSTK